MTEQIERLIETSGPDWTFLRPAIFAGNALHWWAPQIRGRCRALALSAQAPIDERDIAAVAIRVLSEDRYVRSEYVLTGPQSITQLEQVSTIGLVIKRPLKVEEISPEEARSMSGIPAMLLNA